MCDPVTAGVVIGGAIATNEFVVKPQKEAAKAQASAMQQQQAAMQEQQQQFQQAMEQRESSGASQSPAQVQRQELAVQASRDRARRRRFAQSGFSSTMLTGGQGVDNRAATAITSLLGNAMGGSGKTTLGA